MKTLYPAQQRVCDFFISAQQEGYNTLDTSVVGTGKTVVACHMAKALKHPVAVLCPKAVVPSWERELKETGLTPLFVFNYEAVRNGNTPWLDKKGRKSVSWNLPKSTMVIVDEIHKMKGPWTLNAQLLVKLVDQGHKVHGCSATAAKDPTEMRPLGYMLGLHSLNKGVPPLKSWQTWMRGLGCKQDYFKQWKLMDDSKLEGLHGLMHETTTQRLTVADFPDSFKGNHVIEEFIRFGDGTKIAKAYAEYNITPHIVERFILNGTVDDEEEMLVRLLRARQLAESFKVPDITDMVLDLLAEDKSVIVFVNFSDTIDTLVEGLRHKKFNGGISVVRGSQSKDQRSESIDAFQADENRVAIVNSEAGGTGVSLHDLHGRFPRVTLICPTFNEKTHHQVLGRAYRNGAKSDALQKILIAEGTVEEAVVAAITRKLKNMNTLLGE